MEILNIILNIFYSITAVPGLTFEGQVALQLPQLPCPDTW